MQIGGIVVVEEVHLVLVLHKLEQGDEMGALHIFVDSQGLLERLGEREGGVGDQMLDVGRVCVFGVIEWVNSETGSVDNLHSII